MRIKGRQHARPGSDSDIASAIVIRRSALPVLFFSALCQLAAGGCASTTYQPNPDLRPAHGLYIDLVSRSARGNTRMVYRQRSDEATDPAPDVYVVVVGPDRRAEGWLADAGDLALDKYLPSDDKSTSPDMFPWPWNDQHPAAAMLVTFDPPLVDRPRSIAGDEVQQYHSKFDCYNYKGHRIARGTADRTFRIHGFEDVAIDETTYTDCVVLNVETNFDLPWRARIRATETSWLAPKIGVVRKTLSLRGFVLLRLVRGDWHYELLRTEAVAPPVQPSLPAGWRRGAVMLSPIFSQARVAGLIVDTEPIAVPVGRSPAGG